MITSKRILSILEDTNIAQNILQQLGGRKFILATGAKDLVSSGNSLSLKFPKNMKGGANYLTITLNSNDSYNIDFGSLRGNDVKRIILKQNISSNQLKNTFSEVTGLVLNIF